MKKYIAPPFTIQSVNEIVSSQTLTKKRGGPQGKARDIVALMDEWEYSRYDKMDVLDVLGSKMIFEVAYVIYSLEALASSLEKALYDQVFTNYLKVLVDFRCKKEEPYDYIGRLPSDKFPVIQEEPYELFYMASALHWLFCHLHPRCAKQIAEVLLKDEYDRIPLVLLTKIKNLPEKEFHKLYNAIEETF